MTHEKGTESGEKLDLETSVSKKKPMRFVFYFVLFGLPAMALSGLITFWIISKNLPEFISINEYRPLVVTQVMTKDGEKQELLHEFFKERRYVIPFEGMPELVIQAFVSAEDDGFFEHQGISLVAILRASLANFRAGHVVQGGSTITQQVVKSLFLSSERSMTRKIKEAIMAGRIEKNLTKQQILYLYLNQIYLGQGAYGIEAAARVYFNKSAPELVLEEAAFLAGLPRAPSKYNPFTNPERAKERQVYVLKRMYENHVIKIEQMNEAVAKPLKIYRYKDDKPELGAYYVEHVRQYLAQKYGDKAVYEDGLQIILPTSRKHLVAAGKSIKQGLRMIDKRHGYRGPVKHLNTTEEIEAFKKANTEDVVKTVLPFSVLMPNAVMNQYEAVNQSGVKSFREILKEGQFHLALVTDIDNRAKTATALVGEEELLLPMANMEWAKKESDGSDPKPLPKIPSDVLRRGDVIKVQIVKEQPAVDKKKKATPEKELGLVLSLEQKPQVQGGLLSLDLMTGNILAMEGGFEFRDSEFNRVLQAQRQPGSAFKPVIYSAAIEKGYTPASIIVDAPIVYKDEESGKWKPNNFEEKFYGDTTFRQAFINSRNIPTIKLVQDIGVSKLISYANRLGLNGQFNQDLSVSLGSNLTTLMDLTQMFALFPRLGRKIYPVYFESIYDRDGKLLEKTEERPLKSPTIVFSPPANAQPTEPKELKEGDPEVTEPPFYISEYPIAEDPDQTLDPRVATVMTTLLKDVVKYGTGRGALELGKISAGKTGTTSEYKDAWYMGFTPRVITGVWVGYDDQRTLESGDTGSKAAIPIWLEYMKVAMQNLPDEDLKASPGVSFVAIDGQNGRLVDPKSPNGRVSAFINGTEPVEKGKKSTPESVDSEGEFLKEDYQ